MTREVNERRDAVNQMRDVHHLLSSKAVEEAMQEESIPATYLPAIRNLLHRFGHIVHGVEVSEIAYKEGLVEIMFYMSMNTNAHRLHLGLTLPMDSLDGKHCFVLK